MLGQQRAKTTVLPDAVLLSAQIVECDRVSYSLRCIWLARVVCENHL